MRYAKFERDQPREWRRLPWANEADCLPDMRKVLIWAALWAAYFFMCFLALLMGA